MEIYPKLKIKFEKLISYLQYYKYTWIARPDHQISDYWKCFMTHAIVCDLGNLINKSIYKFLQDVIYIQSAI